MRKTIIITILVVLLFTILCPLLSSIDKHVINLLSSCILDKETVSVGYIYLSGLKMPLIIKTSLDKLEWSYIINLSWIGIFTSSYILDDGDIIIAGHIFSYISRSYDIMVALISSEGRIKWIKVYGSMGNDLAQYVAVKDNKIYVLGHTYEYGTMHDADIILSILNLSGNLINTYVIGTRAYDDLGKKILFLDNGDIIIIGDTWAYNVSLSDVMILRLDKNMNIKWAEAIGGSSFDEATSIKIVDDGYIVTGVTRSLKFGYDDGFFFKINDNGRIEYMYGVGWKKADGIMDIVKIEDRYILLGYTSITEEDADIMLLEIRDNGNIIDSYFLRNNGLDSPHTISIENKKILITSYFSKDGINGLMILKNSLDLSKIEIKILSTSNVNATLRFLKIKDIEKNIVRNSWTVKKLDVYILSPNITSYNIYGATIPMNFKVSKIGVKIGEYSKGFDLIKFLYTHIMYYLPFIMMVLPVLVVIFVFTLYKIFRKKF